MNTLVILTALCRALYVPTVSIVFIGFFLPTWTDLNSSEETFRKIAVEISFVILLIAGAVDVFIYNLK